MVNFKSIKVKLLGIIVPLLTIGMLSISLIGYFYSENIITNEIQSKMNYQIAYITEGIEKRLLKHEQLANTLARSVEAFSERATDESYINMIRNVTATNKDTFGSGIWFEAYKFDEGEKYFGPYAYKDNDSIAITMEYSNKEYNYFEYDWYKNATDTTDISVWSNPYYDETSNITMITTSVPFFDDNNKLKGVVSADIDLNSIQDLIKETKVGETGWAFLLNTDGMYIANRDVEKVMQENILDEPNKSLAEIGKVILETKEGGQTYLEADGKYQLYYSQIPKTKWIIGVSISQKELYSPLKGLLQSMIIALIVVLFIITMGIVLYANSLSDRMKKIQDIAESLAHGNFTVMSDIVSNDEIGGLSNSFNQMIGNIKALLKDTIQASEEVSNSATNLAATSEETSASFEEISRTIEDIFHGAEDQSIHAEKSVIIASSLDEKFGELQQNSNIMYENADEVYTANKSGVVVVEELIQKTNANNESMTRIEIAIEELNAKSNNINSILETISSIAGQTNLLALNASIEAARAGEAGIGFAVVADEIRKLAEASDYATDKIKKIVEELQNESDNTVEVMKEVKVITQEQTNAVAEVNKTFYKISKSIETIYNEIENTNNFISLITEDKDNIVSSIENISAVSEETTVASQGVTSTIQEQTAAIEEVAKSAELLNELSVALNQQINKFKI